jgi:Mg-chelatase subunit ChlI
MKKALVLNVIDPTIGGVLIRGEKGTAKSTAVRALSELLPEFKSVKGCVFNCDPEDSSSLCEFCRDKMKNNEIFHIDLQKMKVVNLPVGSTEDRVVGTINIEKVLNEGKKSFEPGILAEVNRGILYIDEVNLLSDHIVDIILDAAAMGENYIEREGISFSHPSRFVLIGTMNPEEGDLRPQLLDRFGLCVEITGIKNVNDRIEVVKRRKEFEKSPYKFIKKWNRFEKQLQKRIIYAKKRLTKVKVPDLMLKIMAQIAIDLNVDGHRADIIMERTSKALAAYLGDKNVNEMHIREASKMVLPHRMRKNPFEDLTVEHDIVEASIQKIKSISRSSKNSEHLENSSEKKK